MKKCEEIVRDMKKLSSSQFHPPPLEKLRLFEILSSSPPRLWDLKNSETLPSI